MRCAVVRTDWTRLQHELPNESICTPLIEVSLWKTRLVIGCHLGDGVLHIPDRLLPLDFCHPVAATFEGVLQREMSERDQTLAQTWSIEQAKASVCPCLSAFRMMM